MSQALRHWALRVVAIFLAGVVSAAISLGSYGERINQLVLDSFTRWQLVDKAPSEIVIVDIDEASLKQLGAWPWPRALEAALVNVLHSYYQVKKVGLDMVFPESQMQEGDELFVQVIRETGTCIGQAFDFNSNQRTKVGYLGKGHPPQLFAKEASGYIGNFLFLAQQGKCFGHISPYLDDDGVVRRIYTQVKWRERAWYYLALEMVESFPLTQSAFTPIPYRIKPEAWSVVSAVDVMFQQIPQSVLKGKFVLVGSSALGLADKVATPVHPWLPGVLIHAELLDGVLHPLPEAPSGLSLFPYVFGFGLVVLFAILLSVQNLKSAGGVFFTSLILWGVGSYFLWESRQSFDVVFPFILAIVSFILLLWMEWHWSLRQHRKIVHLFRGYVAPEIVDRILSVPHPEEVLRPQKREVTIMFADISGFSELSKQLSPEQLVSITQDVLTVITEVVLRYEGTVDKYIGDAVMAFWNAPIAQSNHQQKALQCALDIQKAMEQWNHVHNPLDRAVNVHIALHCGKVVVGDVGTAFRHVYTVIGRVVNETERLLHYGEPPDRIVVSKKLAQYLSDVQKSENILIGVL